MFSCVDQIIGPADVLGLPTGDGSSLVEPKLTLVGYKPLGKNLVFVAVNDVTLPTSLTKFFPSTAVTELFVVTVTNSRTDYRHPMTDKVCGGDESDADVFFTLMGTWKEGLETLERKNNERSSMLAYDATRTSFLKHKVERVIYVQQHSHTDDLTASVARLYYKILTQTSTLHTADDVSTERADTLVRSDSNKRARASS